MATLFAIIFLLSIPALLLGLIAPRVYGRLLKKDFSRGKIAMVACGVMFASFVGVGLTAPPSVTAPKAQGSTVVSEEVKQDLETADIAESAQGEDGDAGVGVIGNDPASPQGRTSATIIKVTDGDTVTVSIDGKQESVRIIGINTPETVDPRKPVECFGKEASARARQLLDGQAISLEADPTQGERDKYGRLLRYVFLSSGSDFGLTMIQEGLAYEYTYSSSYAYQASYKAAQAQAEASGRGLWADSACETPTPLTTAPTTTPSTTPSAPRQETPAATPSPTTPPPVTTSCSCPAADLDCGDFATHDQAQAVYDCCYATRGSDVHRLDGSDNDGLACESLP